MTFDAQVIAAYGRHLTVRDESGREREARPFGRKLSVVCGDHVRCEHDATHDEIHVVDVLPRRSVLQRTSLRGLAEPVVANITQLLAVLAPKPRPDPFIIDRYLCAASSAGLLARIVWNKADLTTSDDDPPIEFEHAGYPVLHCSTVTGVGLDALRAVLAGQISVFVGQSGVGKSSLISFLLPQAPLVTGELDRNDEGRHTTTAARLYDLPGGGVLIDSPGVRDFAPAIESLEPRSLGFPEVDRLAPGCRFLDCAHLREPACAVRTEAERETPSTLSARRYESYRRLRRLYEDLRAARGPAPRGH